LDWLKNYHEDHEAVLLLLAKLEGNMLYFKTGMETPHTFMEFKEFADVIKNVIIPHFKSEESGVYKDVGDYDQKGRQFADLMIQEHEALYPLFESYMEAVEAKDKEKLLDIGGKMEAVLRHHILKEEREMPRLYRLKLK